MYIEDCISNIVISFRESSIKSSNQSSTKHIPDFKVLNVFKLTVFFLKKLFEMF